MFVELSTLLILEITIIELGFKIAHRKNNCPRPTETENRMNLNYLSFEQPIADLEGKIEELQLVGNDSDINIAEEISKLREKSRKLPKVFIQSLPHGCGAGSLPPTKTVRLDYIHAFYRLKKCMAIVILVTTTLLLWCCSSQW